MIATIRKFSFLLIMLWLCLPYESAAQQKRIFGKVFNTSNVPMPGVNVQLKGTQIGTFTDPKGVFTLTIPDTKPAVLVVSAVGFATQEVDVTNSNGEVTVSLAEQVTQLSDVVVVGYGTARKKDLTGSVGSVALSSVDKTPVFGTGQLMQGRVAGVQVTQTNAQPGAAFSVRIRGTNSISMSSEPLYVVDGYAGADIAALNPNDIVSVDVLKDASATAIYGSRGANGVVMITTRRGTAGKKAISFDAYTGVQQVANKLKMMDATQYAEFMNETYANLNPGNTTRPFSDSLIRTLGKGTDYQDELFRNAKISNFNLGVSGGNADTRYFLSMNYFTQDGVIINSNYKRGTLRFNLDSKVSEKIKIGLTSQLSYDNQLLANVNTTGGSTGGTLLDALLYNPGVPVHDNTGQYTYQNGPTNYAIIAGNPVAAANLNSDKQKNTRLFANFFTEYEPVKGLKVRSSIGGEYLNAREDVFRPSTTYLGTLSGGGYAQVVTNNNYNWLNENTVTWDKAFNKAHAINLLGGFTYQEFKNASVTSTVTGLSTNSLGTDNLAIGGATDGSNTSKNSLTSFLGRANYRLLDRFLFTFSFRADASSRFGENHKWGYFPSGAFAWRVKDENFLKEVNAISDLKFRASYGATGNQNIPNYQSLKQYTANTYWLGQARVNGFSPNNLPNPDLRWETTTALDLGFDLAVLDNRIQFTADYYNKKTTDLLYNVLLPNTSGYTSLLQNIGAVRNQGVELAINTINIDKKAIKWTTAFNISANRNKVLDLGPYKSQFTGNVSSNLFPGGKTSSILEVGKPIGEFYGYEFGGIWQSTDQIKKSGTKQKVVPGDPIYKDLNGDSALDATNDRKIIGHALPKFTYGFTSNLTVGRFNLFVLIQGVQGVDILNENKIEMEAGNPYANKFAYVYSDTWRGEGTSNTLPSAGNSLRRNLGVTSDMLEDGSYLRFKTVTLSYDLPLPKLSNVFKSASVYATAQNLFTITNYSGYDPEVNSYPGTQGNFTSLSVDYNPYPNIKTYTVGLKLGF
jgi:TonB-linked SusC/RagA family outer membrane protein